MGKVKLHIGCGKRDFGPEWFHIDKADFMHIKSKDVYLKNIADYSVDLIYACHLIAYFDREEIIPLLKAWKRKLKEGGVLRLATPNWDVLRKMPVPLLGPLYGKMSEPPIYHKTIYTPESLKMLLKSIGFKKIRPYNHRKTEHPNTGDINDRFDDHSASYHRDKLISLNIECTVCAG